MHLQNQVNLIAIAGLVVDMIGVFVLFFFAYPEVVDNDCLKIGEIDEAVEALRLKKRKRIAYLGLSIITLGFLLQILSLFCSFPLLLSK